VEHVTFTKGYVVGEWGSLNQVLSLKSPVEAAVHEAYHFLGCGHEFISEAEACGAKVAEMRRTARDNGKKGRDFFFSLSRDGRIHRTRSEVDCMLGSVPKTDIGVAGAGDGVGLSCG